MNFEPGLNPGAYRETSPQAAGLHHSNANTTALIIRQPERIRDFHGTFTQQTYDLGTYIANCCSPVLACGRLHCPSGPALSYPDGWDVYCWRGVIVSKKIICAHETITPAEIDNEANVEVRRVMIERYGEERYLTDGGAMVLDIDSEFGTLYSKRIDNDEPLVMVKVINSIPEPDGTYTARGHRLRF